MPSSAGGARRVGGEENESGPGPGVMAADTLEGDAVIDPQGEELGTIAEIMIDVQAGCVAYAVMAFRRGLGAGRRLFAIPWNALTLDADRHCFVLQADRERMREAPGFDPEHWPAMADRDWARGIHAYYGARPYWSESAPFF